MFNEVNVKKASLHQMTTSYHLPFAF